MGKSKDKSLGADFPSPYDIFVYTSLPGTVVDASVPTSADIAMLTSVAPFAVPGKSEVALAIVTDVRQPAPKERVAEDMELMARAFTPEGDSRGVQRQNARVIVRPGDNDAEFDVLSRLDLKPGDTTCAWPPTAPPRARAAASTPTS